MIKPAEFAMLILKINVIIFLITVGVSVFSLFPYLMHLNQINNNIALDVANRNFVTEDDLNQYLKHFALKEGDTGASTFSVLTYKKMPGDNLKTGDMSVASLKEVIKSNSRGKTVYVKDLAFNGDSYTVGYGGEAIVGVNVDTQSDSLILNAGSGFDPIGNITDMKAGMDGNYGGKIVNRGERFTVTLKTRYKLTGAAFGFFLTIALPVEAKTIGVTTQYYQIDN